MFIDENNHGRGPYRGTDNLSQIFENLMNEEIKRPMTPGEAEAAYLTIRQRNILTDAGLDFSDLQYVSKWDILRLRNMGHHSIEILTRALAAREDREPELYDLRDSGSIEQDADIVLMLHGHRNKELGERYELHVHLRKHRGGKKDITFVTIPNKTYSAFEEEKPIRDDDDDDLPVQIKEATLTITINS